MKTGAVIVAAGMSTRMSEFKQMMKIGELSMAERVVINFQRAGIKDIVIVTGYQAKMLEKSLQHYGVTFLRNEKYETTEMFDSAKLGLAYLQDKCDQILFCPADVPFFQEDTVERILQEAGKLILPVCGDKHGHPICMDSALVQDVLKYEGGGGLRGALRTLGVQPVTVKIQDKGAITDVDTKEEYEKLLELHNAGLMRPQVRVRLVSKKPFFGPGAESLLKLIDSTGSVKEACVKAGFSYSKGWSIIRAAEEELGYSLVERRQGGKNGGQASVTEKGKKLLLLFEEYEKEVTKTAEKLYQEMFAQSGLV